MRMRTATLALALTLGLALVAHPAAAREPGLTEGVVSKQLSSEPMAGEPGKEVVTFFYSFPPGTVLPWHIHPDAQEIGYVLEGDFVVEIEGEGETELKAGDSFYLHPNKVHRGANRSDGVVKLFVVRIKPTDKPLTVEVEPKSAE